MNKKMNWMGRLALAFAACHLSLCPVGAQTARQVLDKTAQAVSAAEGITANFTMTSAQYGNTSGTIAVKGRKFQATTPVGIIWFDGKTQWTYMKKNDEVNIVTPTEAQLQAINPYTFINMYKEGYKQTMTQNATAYIVHLTATDKGRRVQEMFITVDKSNHHPKEVKLLQGAKWTTFAISSLKRKALDDSVFTFNAKDYPSAEVIDLR